MIGFKCAQWFPMQKLSQNPKFSPLAKKGKSLELNALNAIVE